MLNNKFKKLPLELVSNILTFKKYNKCLICKNYFYNIFYKDYLNYDLCSYQCFLKYFHFYRHICLLLVFIIWIFFPCYIFYIAKKK